MADYKFDTLSLHAGQSPRCALWQPGRTDSPKPPAMFFDSTEHAAALFNMEVGGHIYSRLTNPTVAVLEQRFGRLRWWGCCHCHGFGNVSTLCDRSGSLLGRRSHCQLLANVWCEYQTYLKHTLKTLRYRDQLRRTE